MKAFHKLLISSCLAVFSTSCATAQTLESQFETFLSWWPGTYDNASQIAAGSANPGARLIVREVNLPAFGDHVYYAEWQAMDGPETIIRQRFYGFEIDQERQALRLNLHIFPPTPEFRARTKGAYDDPSRVSDITPADMVPLKGCDVYFTWQDGQFAGSMDKGACAFPAPGVEPPVDIYSWSQMRRSKATFEYLDGWFHLDGSYFQRMTEDWFVFERK